MKKILKLLLSVVVTLGFTWWAFRGTDLHQQWLSLRSANYLLLIPYVLGFLLTVHLARALRWGCLLSRMEKVRFWPLNEAAAIGFMMLIVLPFRLGEFARPFLIAQRSSIRKSPAMTTVVVERIADGVFIAVLLRALLLFVPGDTPDIRVVKLGANLMFLIFGGGFAFLLFGHWQRARAVALVHRTVGLISKGLATKVGQVVEGFIGAMEQMPTGGQRVAFFAYTVVYWALNGLGVWFLVKAFQCQGGAAGCLPLHLTVFQGFVVLSVLVVALMIPAAPGSMGTFQWGVKVGLSLFLPAAVVSGPGLAFANVLWLAQTTQQIVLGLIFLSVSQMSFGDIAGRLGEAEPVPEEATAASPAIE